METGMAIKKGKRRAYVKFMFRVLLTGSTVYLAALLNPYRSAKLAKALRRHSSQELANLRRTLRKLEKQRLIRIVGEGEGAEVRLTPDGRERALRMRLEELVTPRPSSWDRKWRLVFFDVPEYLRVGRDAFRNTLNRLAFYQIQKSIFIFPFPCENEIESMARTLGFERYVHCFHVEIPKGSYRTHLLKHFNLA